VALVNMPKAQAERWIALEFVTAAVVRTVFEMRESNDLLGPSAYGVLIITYGMLAAFALWDETADVAAIIGGLILLAILIRGTSHTGDVPSTVGRDVGVTLGGFAQRTGDAPPTHAAGVTSTAGQGGGSSSGGGGGGGGGGAFNPLDPFGLIPSLGGALGLPVGRTTNATLDALAGNTNV
jgi:uncharacterized membrane protein YgcG